MATSIWGERGSLQNNGHSLPLVSISRGYPELYVWNLGIPCPMKKIHLCFQNDLSKRVKAEIVKMKRESNMSY